MEKSRRDEEWLRFQIEELDNAKIKEGELEELEQEIQELSHAEEIKSALYGAYNNIDGNDTQSPLQLLRDATHSLSRIAEHYSAAQELSERLESNYIELKDCCEEILQRAERIQFAPDRLDFVEIRIAILYNLQKKHHVVSIEELIAVHNNFIERLENITSGDDNIKEAEKRLAILRVSLTDFANPKSWYLL